MCYHHQICYKQQQWEVLSKGVRSLKTASSHQPFTSVLSAIMCALEGYCTPATWFWCLALLAPLCTCKSYYLSVKNRNRHVDPGCAFSSLAMWWSMYLKDWRTEDSRGKHYYEMPPLRDFFCFDQPQQQPSHVLGDLSIIVSLSNGNSHKSSCKYIHNMNSYRLERGAMLSRPSWVLLHGHGLNMLLLKDWML